MRLSYVTAMPFFEIPGFLCFTFIQARENPMYVGFFWHIHRVHDVSKVTLLVGTSLRCQEPPKVFELRLGRIFSQVEYGTLTHPMEILF